MDAGRDAGGTASSVAPGSDAEPGSPAGTFDATMLAVVAVLLRLPMLFADRVARLRRRRVRVRPRSRCARASVPFRDVFSSQGPLFLPLVWVADLVGFRTTGRAARCSPSPPACCSRWRCTRAARRLTTRGNALLAAGLVTTSGSVLWVTGPVNADGPSLALSVLAVAFALRYRDEPRLRTAVWVGLAAAWRVSIKRWPCPRS